MTHWDYLRAMLGRLGWKLQPVGEPSFSKCTCMVEELKMPITFERLKRPNSKRNQTPSLYTLEVIFNGQIHMLFDNERFAEHVARILSGPTYLQ